MADSPLPPGSSKEPDAETEKKAPVIDKLPYLPDLPGVYLYKNKQNDILYIGKAKSLRKRVRSYFRPSANHTLRIQIMVSLVYDVSTIVTDTEAEALILEEQLIKTHRPRYNVALKDDKSYPYCKLTVDEMYPRLFLVRERHNPKAEYYGPYTSSRDARYVLKLIARYFPLRTSKMVLDGSRTYRPCLNYQLKRCLGPCQGSVPADEYKEIVNQVRLFLRGKDSELIQQLETQMYQASEKLEFERAAKIRDQIQATRRIFEKQKVLTHDDHDQDIFNLYREADTSGIQVLFIRNGRLLGTDFFYNDESEKVSDDNLIGQVLNRLYTSENAVIPKEIFLPFKYSDQEVLATALEEKAGRRVRISVPQKGQKKELITMAYNNAKINLIEKRNRVIEDSQILRNVQDALHLNRLPEVVEAFDISNLSGTMTVASMVCWKNNHPWKERYRKYKIQTVEGSDDFASMSEVLTRRYKRSVAGELPLPDLILIDGGKGQVNAAVHILTELGISLDQVDLIGLAKGRSDRGRGIIRSNNEDYEYVVKPNQKNEIRLNRHSTLLYFLQNIRDESHRVAISFQRELKRKENLHSVLDDVPGVGPKRRRTLLRHFGSLKKLREASVEDIHRVSGISESLAESIHGFLIDH